MRVEIWSDIACPWCYIGRRRFETALDGFTHRDEVEMIWRSFQLDPSLPDHFDGTEIEYLSQSKGMPVDQVRQMFDRVRSARIRTLGQQRITSGEHSDTARHRRGR